MTYRYPPVSNLSKLLEALRDVPATTDAAKDDVLGAIYNHLMTTHSNPPGDTHWFCDKADSLTQEAAAFLLRLFAYDSEKVTKWKKLLHDCVSHCAPCARALEMGKTEWRSTYFGAFNPDVLAAFFSQFESWELREVLKDIELATSAISGSPLPPGTLYRMVFNWNIFCDPKVMSYLATHVPPCPVLGWPEASIPPGMLVLLIAEDTALRNWAKVYASASKLIPNDILVRSYIKVLELIISSLEFSQPIGEQGGVSNIPAPLRHIRLAQQVDLWSGTYAIIRLLPPEWLKLNSENPIRLRRVILSHLRDSGPHFQEVFKSFILLMKRLGKDLWIGEGPEYPQTTFEAIKENSYYIDLLHTSQPAEVGTNLFFWFPEYLSTIRDTGSYTKVYMAVIDFLSAEAQFSSLDKNRSTIVKLLFSILHNEGKRLQKDFNVEHRNAFDDVLDAHADLVVSTAYTKPNDGDDWMKARDRARDVVAWTLEANVSYIKTTLNSLSEVLIRHNQGIKKPPPPFTFRDNMWKAIYATSQSFSNTQAHDNALMAKLIPLVAQISHIASIRIEVFSKSWESKECDEILKRIGHAINMIQTGLSSSVSTFADYATLTKALELLRCDHVGRSMAVLLLSPVECLQTAAKTFIGLAFDVDGGRMECFRCLFENLAPETFMGMFQFLKTFNHYADTMPEACSLSAMLVLCFADILDVLCASPDGLLHNQYFLRIDSADGPASRILQFWKLLTHALSLIYKRTPMWATHIDTPDMVIWMRDAVILARDVLKQWKVIECAATAYAKAKPTKQGVLSAAGKQMLESLQEFLPQLVKWLRLTDEELLHQSFALLVSVFDLMKEAHVMPAKAAIDKLAKYVEIVKSGDTSTLPQKTRLDLGRLLQLSQILDGLQDKADDDEVEIVSYTAPIKKPTAEASKKKDPSTQRYILKASQQTKPQPRLNFSSAASGPSRKVSTKFTDKDQQLLDAAIPRPSFRKSKPTATASTSAIPRDPTLGHSSGASQAPDSDSDAESDDLDGPTLDELSRVPTSKKPKVPKVPITKPPTERRQVKMIEAPGVRAKNVREQQRQAANRMKPDISGLHKVLLSWDYNHSGSSPPGPPLQLTQVPDRFQDHDHYFRVFQPLLLMECWAQILQTKDEKRDSFQCKVESRSYSSAFVELDLVISEPVKKDWYLAETDVVLIRHGSLDKCTMGKVKQYRSSFSGIQMTVHCSSQGDPGLHIGTLWQLSKLFSLSTLHREYGALMSLKYNEICPFIMQPNLVKAPDVDQRDLQQTMQTYRVNEPQASAILKVMKQDGISLIQGPPGTGKTSTICGLIGCFLENRPRPTVQIIPGQRTGNRVEDRIPTARILVCAPSNAAIDELAQRIRDGHVRSNQRSNTINIVRIGPEQTLSPSIRNISLDYLVDQKLDNTPKPFNDLSNEIKSIRDDVDTVKTDLKIKREEMEACQTNGARFMTLENEVKTLNAKKQFLVNKLDTKRDQQKSDSRTLDTLRRNTRSQILLQADIICSTLTGAGHESLESLDFHMIIIDEAAQAIELSSLIPLKYGCKRCVMVGDPQQLPPTVISPEATRFGYNQSLFVRLQRSNQGAVHLLSIQYRMHPDISRLPSKVFYDGRLLDGPDMAVKTKQLWHAHDTFGTYKFLNVSWGIEESVGHSISNPAECRVALDLYNCLCGLYGNVDFDHRIGVVSMYKGQVNALRSLFIQRFGSQIVQKVTFNTVDGFQGQEKDIIILSCVRAGPGLQRIGFTADVRRMNVALTRAKSSLFVLGNAATLERSDDTWRAIVQDARSRGSLITMDPAYFTKVGPRPAISASEPVRKKRKTEPTQGAPDIPGLMTPQEFHSTVLSTPSTSRGIKRAADDVDPPLAPDLKKHDITQEPSPAINAIQPKIDHELPSAIDTTQPSASASSLNSDPTNLPPRNPAQPPRKRPKQQTMFIPSKKRPT